MSEKLKDEAKKTQAEWRELLAKLENTQLNEFPKKLRQAALAIELGIIIPLVLLLIAGLTAPGCCKPL